MGIGPAADWLRRGSESDLSLATRDVLPQTQQPNQYLCTALSSISGAAAGAIGGATEVVRLFLDSFRGWDKWIPAMVKLPSRGAMV